VGIRNLLLSLLMFSFQIAQANVIPNSLFTENCVLQQGVEVPVWGTASINEKVTIFFEDQVINAIANNLGKWLVKLKPLKASTVPQQLIIQGQNKITINGILVGEVWLCSGQSNMGFPLRAIKPVGAYSKAATVIKDAQQYPLIRQFSIPLQKNKDIPGLKEDVNGKWLVCDSTTTPDFSAVAYFFGRELFKKLKVPIGLINASYGGTAIENWISRETLESFPELKSIFTDYEKALHAFPEKLNNFTIHQKELMEKYFRDSSENAMLHKETPRKPSPPMSPAERGGPTGLWNTMISPLIPYAIKGCVWYQGEANGSRGIQYRVLLPALINSWRSSWNLGNFPFIIIQIPGWKGHQPELREAQLITAEHLSNTAMTVITDCDDTLDVHPGNKEPVGWRASRQALGLAYGDTSENWGPVYQSMSVLNNQMILHFKHIGSGLIARNGTLKDFEIAGPDKQFVPAIATIINNNIIVSAPEIYNPVAVRMGWRQCPQVNLFNKEGFCATAFRTIN